MRDHPIPHLGDELSALRERAGLTKAEFARRAGISMGALWKYENGRVVPMRPMVIRMAGALGVEPDELQDVVDRSRPTAEAS